MVFPFIGIATFALSTCAITIHRESFMYRRSRGRKRLTAILSHQEGGRRIDDAVGLSSNQIFWSRVFGGSRTFANAERRLSGADYYHIRQNKEKIIMPANAISSTM